MRPPQGERVCKILQLTSSSRLCINLVVAVGFGLVAFLIYHDKSWIPMLVATVVIVLLCQSSYSSRTHATCPLCGHEFVVQEHEKCE